MNYQFYNLVRLSLLSFCVARAGCQPKIQVVAPQAPAEKKSIPDSKSVLLFRSLCLQQFDQESIELVYGMPSQSRISEKLGDIKTDQNLILYLATGRTDYGTWRAPSPSLIKAIASEKVRSVIDAKEDDIVFVVENIDWLSDDHVDLDIGTYHKTIALAGSIMVQLKFVDNKWIIHDQGGCYARQLKNAE